MARGTSVVALTPQEKQIRAKLIADVASVGEKINKLLPRNRFGQLTMDAEYLIQSLELYFSENPKLLLCTPASIVRGVMRVAQTSLILGNSCDLLPFGKNCQFSPRYNGIAQLALAAGTRAINIGVVREGDHFEYDKGTNTFLSHQKRALSTAPITHGYAVANLRPGANVLEVFTAEEINAHRKKYSKSWWKDNDRIIPLEEIPWYAKKTPLRQMAPVLPQNPRLAAALIFEREAEEGLTDDEDEDLRELEAARVQPQLPAAQPTAAPVQQETPVTQEVKTGGPRESERFQDDTDIDRY